MIQRIYRGYRTREAYKARKVMLDIEKLHTKYKRIREEYEAKQRQALVKLWAQRRKKGLALGLSRWKQQLSVLPPKSKLSLRPGRPSALSITPVWKSKVRKPEPLSADLDSTPTRGSESFALSHQMLRRKSTLTRRLESKEKPSKGSKSEIKELPSGHDTEPNTPDSGQALKLRRK